MRRRLVDCFSPGTCDEGVATTAWPRSFMIFDDYDVLCVTILECLDLAPMTKAVPGGLFSGKAKKSEQLEASVHLALQLGSTMRRSDDICTPGLLEALNPRGGGRVDEEFVFDVPPGTHALQVHCLARQFQTQAGSSGSGGGGGGGGGGKAKKRTPQEAATEFVVGACEIPVDRLPEDTHVEQWYQLKHPTDPAQSLRCAVKLRLRLVVRGLIATSALELLPSFGGVGGGGGGQQEPASGGGCGSYDEGAYAGGETFPGDSNSSSGGGGGGSGGNAFPLPLSRGGSGQGSASGSFSVNNTPMLKSMLPKGSMSMREPAGGLVKDRRSFREAASAAPTATAITGSSPPLTRFKKSMSVENKMDAQEDKGSKGGNDNGGDDDDSDSDGDDEPAPPPPPPPMLPEELEDTAWWRRQVVASGLVDFFAVVRGRGSVLGQDGVARPEATVTERWPQGDLADGAEFPQRLDLFCFPGGWEPVRGLKPKERKKKKKKKKKKKQKKKKQTEQNGNMGKEALPSTDSSVNSSDGSSDPSSPSRTGATARKAKKKINKEKKPRPAPSCSKTGPQTVKPPCRIATFAVQLCGATAWGVCLIDHELRWRVVPHDGNCQSGGDGGGANSNFAKRHFGKSRSSVSTISSIGSRGGGSTSCSFDSSGGGGEGGEGEGLTSPRRGSVGAGLSFTQEWWWPVGFCVLTRFPVVPLLKSWLSEMYHFLQRTQRHALEAEAEEAADRRAHRRADLRTDRVDRAKKALHQNEDDDSSDDDDEDESSNSSGGNTPTKPKPPQPSNAPLLTALPAETALAPFLVQVALTLPRPVDNVLAVEFDSFGAGSARLKAELLNPHGLLPFAFDLRASVGVLGAKGFVDLLVCALGERKLLLFSKDLSTLTPLVEALCCLLYPLKWSHIIVPVLPRLILETLEAPQPYIVGIHTDWLAEVPASALDDVVMVDVDSGTVEPFETSARADAARARDNAASVASGRGELPPLPAAPTKALPPPVEANLLALLRDFLYVTSSTTPTDSMHNSSLAGNVGRGAPTTPSSPTSSTSTSTSFPQTLPPLTVTAAASSAAAACVELRMAFAAQFASLLAGFEQCVFWVDADYPVFDEARFLEDFTNPFHAPYVAQLLATQTFHQLLETFEDPDLALFHSLVARTDLEGKRRPPPTVTPAMSAALERLPNSSNSNSTQAKDHAVASNNAEAFSAVVVPCVPSAVQRALLSAGAGGSGSLLLTNKAQQQSRQQPARSQQVRWRLHPEQQRQQDLQLRLLLHSCRAGGAANRSGPFGLSIACNRVPQEFVPMDPGCPATRVSLAGAVAGAVAAAAAARLNLETVCGEEEYAIAATVAAAAAFIADRQKDKKREEEKKKDAIAELTTHDEGSDEDSDEGELTELPRSFRSAAEASAAHAWSPPRPSSDRLPPPAPSSALRFPSAGERTSPVRGGTFSLRVAGASPQYVLQLPDLNPNPLFPLARSGVHSDGSDSSRSFGVSHSFDDENVLGHAGEAPQKARRHSYHSGGGTLNGVTRLTHAASASEAVMPSAAHVGTTSFRRPQQQQETQQASGSFDRKRSPALQSAQHCHRHHQHRRRRGGDGARGRSASPFRQPPLLPLGFPSGNVLSLFRLDAASKAIASKIERAEKSDKEAKGDGAEGNAEGASSSSNSNISSSSSSSSSNGSKGCRSPGGASQFSGLAFGSPGLANRKRLGQIQPPGPPPPLPPLPDSPVKTTASSASRFSATEELESAWTVGAVADALGAPLVELVEPPPALDLKHPLFVELQSILVAASASRQVVSRTNSASDGGGGGERSNSFTNSGNGFLAADFTTAAVLSPATISSIARSKSSLTGEEEGGLKKVKSPSSGADRMLRRVKSEGEFSIGVALSNDLNPVGDGLLVGGGGAGSEGFEGKWRRRTSSIVTVAAAEQDSDNGKLNNETSEPPEHLSYDEETLLRCVAAALSTQEGPPAEMLRECAASIGKQPQLLVPRLVKILTRMRKRASRRRSNPLGMGGGGGELGFGATRTRGEGWGQMDNQNQQGYAQGAQRLPCVGFETLATLCSAACDSCAVRGDFAPPYTLLQLTGAYYQSKRVKVRRGDGDEEGCEDTDGQGPMDVSGTSDAGGSGGGGGGRSSKNSSSSPHKSTTVTFRDMSSESNSRSSDGGSSSSVVESEGEWTFQVQEEYLSTRLCEHNVFSDLRLWTQVLVEDLTKNAGVNVTDRLSASSSSSSFSFSALNSSSSAPAAPSSWSSPVTPSSPPAFKLPPPPLLRSDSTVSDTSTVASPDRSFERQGSSGKFGKLAAAAAAAVRAGQKGTSSPANQKSNSGSGSGGESVAGPVTQQAKYTVSEKRAVVQRVTLLLYSMRGVGMTPHRAVLLVRNVVALFGLSHRQWRQLHAVVCSVWKDAQLPPLSKLNLGPDGVAAGRVGLGGGGRVGGVASGGMAGVGGVSGAGVGGGMVATNGSFAAGVGVASSEYTNAVAEATAFSHRVTPMRSPNSPDEVIKGSSGNSRKEEQARRFFSGDRASASSGSFGDSEEGCQSDGGPVSQMPKQQHQIAVGWGRQAAAAKGEGSPATKRKEADPPTGAFSGLPVALSSSSLSLSPSSTRPSGPPSSSFDQGTLTCMCMWGETAVFGGTDKTVRSLDLNKYGRKNKVGGQQPASGSPGGSVDSSSSSSSSSSRSGRVADCPPSPLPAPVTHVLTTHSAAVTAVCYAAPFVVSADASGQLRVCSLKQTDDEDDDDHGGDDGDSSGDKAKHWRKQKSASSSLSPVQRKGSGLSSLFGSPSKKHDADVNPWGEVRLLTGHEKAVTCLGLPSTAASEAASFFASSSSATSDADAWPPSSPSVASIGPGLHRTVSLSPSSFCPPTGLLVPLVASGSVDGSIRVWNLNLHGNRTAAASNGSGNPSAAAAATASSAWAVFEPPPLSKPGSPAHQAAAANQRLERSGSSADKPQAQPQKHNPGGAARSASAAVASAAAVRCLELDSWGRFLASGSSDGFLRLWDVDKESLVQAVHCHAAAVRCVRFKGGSINHSNRLVLTGSNDRTACLTDLRVTGLSTQTSASSFDTDQHLGGGGGGANATAATSPGGDSSGGRGHGGVVRFHGHAAPVTCLDPGADSDPLFFTGSADSRILVWDARTSRMPLWTLEAHSDTVVSLKSFGLGNVLVSAGQDGTVCEWDVRTGQLRRRHECGAPIICAAEGQEGGGGGGGEGFGRFCGNGGSSTTSSFGVTTWAQQFHVWSFEDLMHQQQEQDQRRQQEEKQREEEGGEGPPQLLTKKPSLTRKPSLTISLEEEAGKGVPPQLVKRPSLTRTSLPGAAEFFLPPAPFPPTPDAGVTSMGFFTGGDNAAAAAAPAAAGPLSVVKELSREVHLSADAVSAGATPKKFAWGGVSGSSAPKKFDWDSAVLHRNDVVSNNNNNNDDDDENPAVLGRGKASSPPIQDSTPLATHAARATNPADEASTPFPSNEASRFPLSSNRDDTGSISTSTAKTAAVVATAAVATLPQSLSAERVRESSAKERLRAFRREGSSSSSSSFDAPSTPATTSSFDQGPEAARLHAARLAASERRSQQRDLMHTLIDPAGSGARGGGRSRTPSVQRRSAVGILASGAASAGGACSSGSRSASEIRKSRSNANASPTSGSSSCAGNLFPATPTAARTPATPSSSARRGGAEEAKKSRCRGGGGGGGCAASQGVIDPPPSPADGVTPEVAPGKLPLHSPAQRSGSANAKRGGSKGGGVKSPSSRKSTTASGSPRRATTPPNRPASKKNSHSRSPGTARPAAATTANGETHAVFSKGNGGEEEGVGGSPVDYAAAKKDKGEADAGEARELQDSWHSGHGGSGDPLDAAADTTKKSLPTKRAPIYSVSASRILSGSPPSSERRSKTPVGPPPNFAALLKLPSPVNEGSLESAAAPGAAAAPAAGTATTTVFTGGDEARDLTAFLTGAKLSTHEAGLRQGGFAEVADLVDGDKDELFASIGMKKPEVKRLRRYLAKVLQAP